MKGYIQFFLLAKQAWTALKTSFAGMSALTGQCTFLNYCDFQSQSANSTSPHNMQRVVKFGHDKQKDELLEILHYHLIVASVALEVVCYVINLNCNLFYLL